MIRIIIVFLLQTANGFVEILNLTENHLGRMPNVNSYSNLQHLYLDLNKIETIDKNSTSLQMFSIVSNHIASLHRTDIFYPNLTFFDLSSNPIEFIDENFFTNEHFPRLKTLKLVKALNELNPFLMKNRTISFADLNSLDELFLDENDFDEFFCSKTSSNFHWKLPPNLRRLSLSKNHLMNFDGRCFFEQNFLVELDLHKNYFEKFSSIDVKSNSLQKLRLDSNFLTKIPQEFLRSLTNLTELDLSMNPLSFNDDIKENFGENLRIFHLRKFNNEFLCSAFENFHRLEILDLSDLQTTELPICLFTKMSRLKTLNLSNHRLKKLSRRVFSPLFDQNQHQLDTIDIRSEILHCNSCSLNWLVDLIRLHNKTSIRCSMINGNEFLLNTFKFPSCSTSRTFSIVLIVLSICLAFCLVVFTFIYVYSKSKFSPSKCSPMYRLVPLRHLNRVYETTNEDITNDNVMLVT